MKKPLSFPRFHASARGICYTGVSVVISDGRGEYSIFAPNIEDLKTRWRLITHLPLDESLVQKTALFSMKSISTEGRNGN